VLWGLKREPKELKGEPKELAVLTRMPSTSVAFSPDGVTLVCGCHDGAVRVWNVAEPNKPKERAPLKGHKGVVRAVAFSPDGKALASGGDAKAVRVWEWPAGTLQRGLQGHRDAVTSVTFLAKGGKLASASADWSVKVWDATTGEELDT